MRYTRAELHIIKLDNDYCIFDADFKRVIESFDSYEDALNFAITIY